MTVRIGNVELIGVQNIYTEETRNLVEQRVPDQKGSIFQDLGREPVTIVLEGLIFGENVLPDLEKLRQAQEKAEPLAFAADIAVGTELTEVVIEDIAVRQVAGYASRYRFSLRVREHVEPPESPAKAVAPVNEAVAADADAWAGDGLAAADSLQNPANIPGNLAANPGALAQMSAADLTSAISNNMGDLTGSDFGSILSAVGSLDPDKMGDVFESLNSDGLLGGFMEKFAAEGLNLVDMLKDIDIKGLVEDLVGAFTGGADFIQKAKKVGELAARLLKDITDFNTFAGIDEFLKK